MADILKLEFGKPETIAFKFDSGKEVQGRFGPQLAFSAIDPAGRDQILYLDRQPAAEVERSIRELGIRTREFFRIAKVKDGNVTRIHLERIPANGTPTNGTGAGAHSWQGNAPAPVQPTATTASEPAQNNTPAPTKYMAAYAAAIDTLIEARTYAQRKGLALEIRCEDVRCLAASIIIDLQKCTGGTR